MYWIEKKNSEGAVFTESYNENPYKFPNQLWKNFTAWKVPKYGIISGSYFPEFSPNTEKYGQERTPYFDTFHSVFWILLNFTIAIT